MASKLKWCFFSNAVLFSVLSKCVSDWSVNFLREKRKKNINMCRKKQKKLRWNFNNCIIYLFFTYFWRYLFFCEWGTCQLFLDKRKNNRFLFLESGEEKTKFPKSSKELMCKLFPGKNIRYLCVHWKKRLTILFLEINKNGDAPGPLGDLSTVATH